MDRYIVRQLAGPLLFASFALTGVIWLTQSLRVVDRIVNQGLPFSSFVYMTMLLLPNILTLILPVAMFGAVLFSYNRLVGDSELIVMRAVGWDDRTLARPALAVSVVVTAIMFVLSVWVGPWGQAEFRSTQYEFRSNLSGMLLQEGVFNAPSPGLTVYIRERSPNGELHGVLVHDNRDTEKPVTLMAEKGALVKTADGPRFVMVNGNRQQIEQGKRDVGLLFFSSYTLDLRPYIKDEGAGWRDPGERPLGELLQAEFTNADDIRNIGRLVKEAHRRLSLPLLVPAFTLVALAAVLGGEFSRRGQGKRLMLGALAALALQVFSLGANYLAGKSPSMIAFMYVTPLLFAGGAWLVILRGNALRRGLPAVAPEAVA